MTDPPRIPPSPGSRTRASPQPGQAPPYPGQPYGQQPQYGAPGPYGAPPAYQAPIQPPKKKKKWPWIVGILVVLIVIIAAVSGGGDEGTDNTASSGNSNSAEQAGSGNGDAGDDKGDKKTDEQAAGLNTPVRDGKFEFVITNVESGVVVGRRERVPHGGGPGAVRGRHHDGEQHQQGAEGLLAHQPEALRHRGPQLRARYHRADLPRRQRHSRLGQHQSG